MSRNFDQNRPFTEEEKEWLRSRSHGASEIRINDARFGHLSEDEKEELRKEFDADAEADAEEEARRRQEEEEEFDEEDLDYVSQLKTTEVKAKIREAGFEPEGTKANELKFQLLEILDAKRRGI
jgi:hypothetical protein